MKQTFVYAALALGSISFTAFLLWRNT